MSVCLLLLFLLLVDLSNSTSLRLVFALTRHGDRGPLHPYPKLSPWEHLGELTGEGMHQLYELGKYLRTRYVETGFLTQQYTAKEIYARSTSRNRALVSAQSLLAGLYPPGTGPKRANGDYGLPNGFQAIPIQSEGKKDFLLHGYKNCPPVKQMIKLFRNTSAWIEQQEKHAEFLEKVSLILGLEEAVPLQKSSALYHGVKAERIHFKNDGGVTDEDFALLEELKNWSLSNKYWQRSIGRLSAGLLVDLIVDSFVDYAKNEQNKPNIAPVLIKEEEENVQEKKEEQVEEKKSENENEKEELVEEKLEKKDADEEGVEKQKEKKKEKKDKAEKKDKKNKKEKNKKDKYTPKFSYFSAHDGTLLALFSAMGIPPSEVEVPHYAAMVLFELHQEGNEWFVKVEYINQDPAPKPLHPKWTNVTLTQFQTDMEDGQIEIKEYLKLCGLENKPKKEKKKSKKECPFKNI